MGVRDLGLWLTGFGKSIRGGGIRCFETRTSKESSRSLASCYSGSGEELLRHGSFSIGKN